MMRSPLNKPFCPKSTSQRLVLLGGSPPDRERIVRIVSVGLGLELGRVRVSEWIVSVASLTEPTCPGSL